MQDMIKTKDMVKIRYIYIYISFVICVCIALAILSHLGTTIRHGAIANITFNIQKTLELNHSQENPRNFATQEEFKEYLNTQSFSVYSYNFKIITESKFFKRNAIYAFYPDMDKIPNAFHTFHFDRHRVHGSFMSSRLLTSQDSIPITYTLQLQTLLYSILFTLAIIYDLIDCLI